MCAFCDLRLEFGVEHPLSLSVALATRQAIDAGTLPDPARGGDPIDGALMRMKAVGSLREVQRRIEHSLARGEFLQLPDFFVLMIESRTWGFFHPTADGFDPACRREPPRPFAGDATGGDAVVLASETAMQQTIAGKLPFERALEQGLIAIDADEDREALLQSGAGVPMLAGQPTTGEKVERSPSRRKRSIVLDRAPLILPHFHIIVVAT